MNDKMTIVFFSGTMDKAIAMLTMATAAASMNMDVTVFFTFWGLSFLKKGKKFKKKNLLQKIMESIVPHKMGALPLTYMNMFGIGPLMMERMMKKANLPGIEELFDLAKGLNVKFLACSTSCNVMGVDRDNLIDETEDVVGAVSYIKEAKESKVNLFI